jgi:hypothetical protein
MNSNENIILRFPLSVIIKCFYTEVILDYTSCSSASDSGARSTYDLTHLITNLMYYAQIDGD